MYKENEVHWNNDFKKFAGKCMQLENIILCAVTQTQKEKYAMFSLISEY